MDPIQLILARFRHFPISPFINTIHLSQKSPFIYIFTPSSYPFVLKKYMRKKKLNKKAQRSLGRSPEEKVKGHSGAIYRGSLMLSTKYW